MSPRLPSTPMLKDLSPRQSLSGLVMIQRELDGAVNDAEVEFNLIKY